VFPVNAGVPIVVMMTAVVMALAIGAWRRPSVQVQPTGGFVIGGGSPSAAAGDKSVASSPEAGHASPVSERVQEAQPEVRPDLSTSARAEHQASLGETRRSPGEGGQVGLQIDPQVGQQPATLPGKPGAGTPRDAAAEHASFSSNRSVADGGSSAALAKSNGRRAADVGRGAGATAIGNQNLMGGQAGGVREGSLLDEAGPSDSARRGSAAGVSGSRGTVPASPTAASAGWSNADVPPALRTYVREYLSAVERQVERR
jgi:hypothetical protein